MWVPYVIPPCPTVIAGDKYVLSAKVGAIPSKNPSQYLEWKELLPKAPSTNALHVLGIRSGTLVWTATEDCDE
jgi:hypothetical protein